MKAMKLYEIEGIQVPDPYKRTIKILVTPEKDVKPLGLSIPIRVTNAIESKKGTVGVSLIEPGKGMEPHIHKDEDETIFIISGRGEYTFKDGFKGNILSNAFNYIYIYANRWRNSAHLHD